MTVTLVIPCFNEARRLPERELLEWVSRDSGRRILLVNDGSTDATAEVLEGLRRRCPEAVAVLPLERNCGKAEAIRQGMLQALAAGTDFLGYWDADLATPLDEVARFVERFAGNPAVVLVMGARIKMLGTRIIRKEYRHYVGRVFATCASLIMGLPAYDTQCGAKLFRVTPWLAALFAQPMVSRWLVDIELLFRLDAQLAAQGGPTLAAAVHELPLSTWRDVSLSKVKPADFFISLAQLVKLRLRYGKCRSDHGRDAP